MRILFFILLLQCFPKHLLFAQAQPKDTSDKKKWDVLNPKYPYQTHTFTVTEGTWMNLDLSPDGKTIVFDLLGDIYSMPITGGKARVLRQNLAMEVQPQFSPDGKKILFTSDAGGGDNIWWMNTDGSDAKQITKENFRLLNNAVFTPDGQYIIARKHFTSGRSLGAGELWIYHTTGGDGLQLTARKNDQQDVNEPCVSPDGRYVYYSEDMYPGGYFQYNKDPNNQIFVINRYDRQEGKIERVTGGPGSACRPQLSHSGELLAFVRRVREKSVLYLRNLETAEEWPIYDKLSKDQMEAWTTFGAFTRFAWTPDDQHIIIWSMGKIWKIAVQGANTATEIPFTLQVQQQIAEALRYPQNLNPDSFKVHVIRDAVTSPDGKLLVFNALGRLWKMSLPNGQPQRLTNGHDVEAEPAFSRDGKQIVYVTWNDTAAGALYITTPAGGIGKKVSKKKAIYRAPSFSHDGKELVFIKQDGDNVLGPAFTANTGIYTINTDGSKEVFVTDEGSHPVFSTDGNHILYLKGNDLIRTNRTGKEGKKLFTNEYAHSYTLSPDGKWVAFVHLHQVYVAAFTEIGKTINLDPSSNAYPVKKVSKDAGLNLHWSGDGKRLHYTLGHQYYTIPLADRFSFVAGKADSNFKAETYAQPIVLNAKTFKPTTLYAYTNARIITMKGDEIIEQGTVVVSGNKIIAVGKNAIVPNGAVVVDCKGKTIIPGFIDAHAHAVHFRSGLTPQKHWPYYVNLAFGVTAMHDPSANSEMVFAQSEMIKAGQMIGPRVYSTGTILYGADGDFKTVINSLEDARSALRRASSYGAFSVKSYNQPRREQNQQVLQAARELKINVVPEGGSFFYHNLAMINDGHTTIEHNLPVAPLYDDVIQLWKRSKTAYTPTLIVNYGAPNAEYYWFQKSNVWENKRLSAFTPRNVLDTRGRWRTILPEEEYNNGHILTARSCKKLVEAGVPVNIGAHGQIQGIGAHWEIWSMAQGGMSNHDALRTATIFPAVSLGFDNYIGSIEVGKLADFLVLDKNPLDDIFNTESIRYTIANGRMFDAHTMIEYSERSRPRFYWELMKNGSTFLWNDGATHELDVD